MAENANTDQRAMEDDPMAPHAPAAPAETTVTPPGPAAIARTWTLLVLGTGAANLVVLAIAGAAGASMVADVGVASQEVGSIAILAVTAATLLSSTVVWGIVAIRVPALASLWTPIGWGVGLVSLAMLIGVSDLGTGLALGTMHILTTIAATHLLPRMLPRRA